MNEGRINKGCVRGEFQDVFYDNIILYRKRKGLTQEKLALKMNKKRTYISWLESGKGNPTLEVVLLLAKHLEIEPGCLFMR